MLDEFLKAFFAIFVVMNVFGKIPLFISLSRKLKKKEKKHSVNKAMTIATFLLLLFLLFGRAILAFFGVTVDSFMIAGGIIVFLVGLEMVMGIRLREKHYEKYEFATVPLATPLITGPGVITTIILLESSVGFFITLAASAANLILVFVALSAADIIHKFLGRQGSDVLARVTGLMLVALAVEFVKKGIIGFL